MQVLKFVNLWTKEIKGKKEVQTNKANWVSSWKTGDRYIFYPADKSANYRGSSAFIKPWLRIGEQFDKNALDYLGLEDINYHFQNTGNSISERVQRALSLYDAGTTATTNWMALYQFVVCIDHILPTSESAGDAIVKHLEALIKHSGSHYFGTMKGDTKTTSWDKLVELTTEPFKDFYKLRSQILHGREKNEDNEFIYTAVSDSQVSEARQLAHNAIRMFAKVAHELKWTTYKEGKKWFQSPKSPSSVQATLSDDASQE